MYDSCALLTTASKTNFDFLLILFCRDRENSVYIVKFSLHTERTEATISVSGYTARKTGYQWCGGYCGMDLAVDEQGLWVLWASTGNSGKLYASKIDLYKNVITRTWTLNTGNHKINIFIGLLLFSCLE